MFTFRYESRIVRSILYESKANARTSHATEDAFSIAKEWEAIDNKSEEYEYIFLFIFYCFEINIKPFSYLKIFVVDGL